MIHRVFCISALEKLTRHWTGGSYLVMKSTPIVPGVISLMSIGYKYNYGKVL